jgi:hypothetical protein
MLGVSGFVINLSGEFVMKRLYFVVPGIGLAKKIVDELLLQRIDIDHIHVLAKRGTAMDDLPEASALQKTDIVPALEQGMLTGGFAGLIAGLIVLAMAGESLFSGGTLLAACLGGGAFGAFASSLVGSSVGNRQIKQFSTAINDHGAFLMMVDVQKSRIDEVQQGIKQRHPEAMYEGIEPTIPAFP